MNKNEVATTLNSAILNHKKWVSNALALIEGVPLDKNQVPVNPTECEFGQWFYSVGQKLIEIPGFNDIEESHNNLHRTYMEIFAILFGEGSEPSFFSKLIGRSNKILAANREEAMGKYSTLEMQSKAIITQLQQMKKIITAMSDKQFEKYFI